MGYSKRRSKNTKSSRGFSIVPLADQPRGSFSCGIPALDIYLREQAGQDARWKVAAPLVLLDQTGIIAGYYTLSAFAISPSDLSDDIARKPPRYPLLPATLLGPLAISHNYQGLRLGQMLLMDALQRSWRNAKVASIGVVAEAYNKQGNSISTTYLSR